MNNYSVVLMRRLTSILLAILIAAVFIGCASKTPCKKCGNTPTKAYKNESSGKDEYYCKSCTSSCVLCHKEAKHHYTSLLGIMFVCDSCWSYIKGIND